MNRRLINRLFATLIAVALAIPQVSLGAAYGQERPKDPEAGVIAEFLPLEPNSAKFEGGGYNDLKNVLPDRLTVRLTSENTTGAEQTIDIAVDGWTSVPEYDAQTPGVYVFSPTLPDGFIKAEGAAVPAFTVTVANEGAPEAGGLSLMEQAAELERQMTFQNNLKVNSFTLRNGLASPQAYVFNIGDEEMLRELAELVNNGVSWGQSAGVDIPFAESSYKLTSSIKLTGEWTAIGSGVNWFKGTFDGGGNQIEGLYINKGSEDYQGLFGCAEDAVIKDLGLTDVNITGQNSVGGIVGRMFNTNISGCYSAGAITAENNAGGIAGEMFGESITDSYSAGAITTTVNYAGGIAGTMYEGDITGSYSTGAITAENNAGGIAGTMYEGDITGSYSAGAITTTVNYAGGIAGEMNEGSSITDSYSTGDITATGDYAGGIAGKMYGGSSITDSYSAGAITANFFAGGIAGYKAEGISSSIADSYSTGAINATGKGAGGIVGVMYNGDITGSYSTGAINATGESAGGIAGEIHQGSSITGSYSTGAINAGYNAGGITGYLGREGSITDSYSTGAITAEHYAGGISGDVLGGKSITGCYSAGPITAENNAGGIAGLSYAGVSITNNVALNPSVKGKLYAGKVVGTFSDFAVPPVPSDCYAISSLVLTGSGDSRYDGEALAYNTNGFDHSWADMLGDLTNWENAAATSLPTLKGVGGAQSSTVPEHIKTPASPVEISSLADLKAFRDAVNGEDGYSGETVRLMANIDVSSETNWVPIGVSSRYPFEGTFDGGGYEIRGLSVNRPSEDGMGLFGYTEDAAIKDLGVTNVNITGRDYVGGVVGYPYNTNISGCYSAGAITGEDGVGGIAGLMEEGSITGSYSAGAINARINAGGIAGLMKSGSITNSYSAGAITARYNAGGIAGKMNGGSSITDSYSARAITANVDSAGGIAGYSDVGANIINCVALNPSVSSPSYAGRIVGQDVGMTTPSNIFAIKALELTGSGGIDGDELVYDSETGFSRSWADMLGSANLAVWENTGAKELPILANVGGAQSSAVPDYMISTVNGAEPILTEQQLKDFRNRVNAGDDYSGKAVALAADIVITDADWEPIGSNITPFNGKFDGNGCTISGLTINDTANGNKGLFGVTGSSSEILSLGLLDVSINGDPSTGGLVGSNQGKISDCFVTGVVFGTEAAGGLTGENRGSILNCYSITEVSAGGGLAGGIAGSNGGQIQHCYSVGAVSADNHAGGIAGSNAGGILSSAAFNLLVDGMNGPAGRITAENTGNLTGNYGLSSAIIQNGAGDTGENTINGADGLAWELAMDSGLFPAANWNLLDGRYPSLKAHSDHVIQMFGLVEQTPHKVTVNAMLDGAAASIDGFTLKSGATEIIDLDFTPNGRYDVLLNGVDTGRDVTVSGKDASVTVNCFSVEFYDGAAILQTQILVEGAKAVRPANPTKAGFAFLNWMTTADGDTPFDFNTPITAKTQVYAAWTKLYSNVTVNATLDGVAANIGTFTLKSGDNVVTDLSLTPYGTYDVLLNGVDTGRDVTVSGTEASVTVNCFSVELCDGAAILQTQIVAEGMKAVRPANPTKDGFTFRDWMTTADGDTPFDFNQPITAKTQVYAAWTKNTEPSGGGRRSDNSNVTTFNGVTTIKAGSEVPESDADKAVAQAEHNDSHTILVAAEGNAVTLPKDMAADMANKTSAGLEIRTNNVTVRIPNEALAGLPEGRISVAVDADGVAVTAGGKQLTGIDGMTVSIPHTGDARMEITYPDGSKAIVDAMYNNGLLTFTTDGSARFVILEGEAEGEAEEAKGHPFNDVEGHWAQEAMLEAYKRGLFTGVSETELAPDMTVTRGMVITVLYRMSGQKADRGHSFTDVAQDAYYAEAAAWGQAAGIVNGYEDGGFRPDASVTREQLAVMLYNYARHSGVDVSDIEGMAIREFTDYEDISDWAETAVRFCLNAGIMNGRTDGSFDPKGGATRAEMASMLVRLLAKLEAE